ncbi:hypothetical protein [Streptomyces sp. GC420]|uniref:hypothetical protein n=1 Tax=Streptomyces sp. GC420 TaxID=2697568 RepID=UPI001FB63613|nr:hypothetical protein [Streptomyces sp. GC420]
MTSGLDALPAALYVFIDDHVPPRHRIGRPPKSSNPELLCLAVAQVLLGFPSARHRLRFAHARLRHLFPHLPAAVGLHQAPERGRPLISCGIEARPIR